MPRPRLPPNLLTGVRTKHFRLPVPQEAPRLWNAKRRIKGSIGLNPRQLLQIDKFLPPGKWLDQYKERWEEQEAKLINKEAGDTEPQPSNERLQSSEPSALNTEAAGETEPQLLKEGLESSEPSALNTEAAGETESQSLKRGSESSETNELNEEADEIELPPWKPLSKEDVYAIQKVMNEDGVLEWWKLDRKRLDKFMDVHPELRRVSSDVRSFIWETGLEQDQSSISALLQNPVRFFSASANVPYETRKQIYL